MSSSSPASHPHTTHYLRSIVRTHRSAAQSASSPLSLPADGSPPSGGLTPASSDHDEPSSSSASSLSSSPRKQSIASSTDGESSIGGASGRARNGTGAEGDEGELVSKVVSLLADEDEDTLKELLRDELGLGYEPKVDPMLDAHILRLMHTHRDDSTGVPFLASSSSNTTPKRPSSRTSNSSLSKTSIPFRPLTPLALHRPQSPSTNGGPPSAGSASSPSFAHSSLHAYSAASSSPSPKLHHALPSSPLASPVSSPRTLSAKAIEFRPSPKASQSLISPLTLSVGGSGSGADWSSVVSGRAPPLTRSLSSNLAIAAPLFAGSPSLSDDPDFMVNPNASSSPFTLSSPSTPNALTRSSTPRIDDDEDDFSPFGTSLPSNSSSSWPPSSSSNSYTHPDQEEADLLEIEWAMQEASLQAGGPPTAPGSSMTPMDILSSIFTSLTTHELEVALHKWGYDLDSTMQYLIAAGESGDKTSSASALGAVRAFVPREGYVVAGGRNGSLASSGSLSSGMGGVGGAGAILQHGASASRVIGDGIGGGAGGSPSRFGTRSPFGGRVCRYYLQGECRRADCRFSHDIERALCRFWLRGQCAKGDQCEFIHNLPSGFDPQALSNAIANIEMSTSPETATGGPSRPSSNTPRTPPPEDFPELGGGSKGSASARVPAVKIDAGRTRFSSAVKKPLPASLLPVSTAPSPSLPTGPKASSAGNVTPTSATPLPRPSPRITLRPPSLLPTLPTGSSLNTMYMAARQRAIQYGGLRNQSLSKAADAWRKGDGAAAKRWSKEGQDWNEKMTAEGNEAASRLVFDRRRIVQSAVLARSNTLSTDPLDRSRKGKGVGNGLGCLLGIASSSTPGAGELTSGEREEVIVDLHGLHGTEAIAVLESFLVALEADHFLGLAYALVGEEKHTGTQDTGRGASKVRLASSVKVWLGQWGYAWSESRGVLCIDPLTHFEV